MTLNRRAMIGASAAAIVPASLTNSASAGDREILALEKRIAALYDQSAAIYDAKLAPHIDEHVALVKLWCSNRSDPDVQRRLAEFQARTGYDEAVRAEDALWRQADPLIETMLAIPAASREARAAKLRILIGYVLDGEDQTWIGPDDELDWPVALCRRLLGEYAGMDEAALAAIPKAA